MAIIGFSVIVAFALAQVVAGYAGIEYHLGAAWAIGALAIGFLLRFTLPITIGAFYGAMDAWGWHWVFAAIFAAPGLLFLIPGIAASIASNVRE